MKTIDISKKEELIKVLRKNQIIFAAVFGSRARGIADVGSDYDILVEFDPRESIPLSRFLDVKDEIEKVIKKKVDLVTIYGLGNKRFKQEVLKTMKVLYGRKRIESMATQTYN